MERTWTSFFTEPCAHARVTRDELVCSTSLLTFAQTLPLQPRIPHRKHHCNPLKCIHIKVKLLPKRRFAYIGFLREGDAKSATRYLDQTYLDTSQIGVTAALAYGDAALPRPWSKFSVGSSANAEAEAQVQRGRPKMVTSAVEAGRRAQQLMEQSKAMEGNAAVTRMEKEKALLKKAYGAKIGETDDSELQEFLNAHSSKRSRAWGNDAAVNRTDPKPKQPHTAEAEKKPKVTAKFAAVEGKMYGSRGMPMVRSHVTFEDSDASEDEYQTIAGNAAGAANDEGDRKEEDEQTVAKDAAVSDLDYLKSKMKSGGAADDDSDSSDSSDSSGDDRSNASDGGGSDSGRLAATSKSKRKRKKSGKGSLEKETAEDVPAVQPFSFGADGEDAEDGAGAAASAEGDQVKDTIAERAKRGIVTIRMRGLPFTATDDDVLKFFAPMVPLDIRLTENREGKPSGRCFVDFPLKEQPAALAYNRDHMGERYIEVTPDEDDDRPEPAPVVVKPPRKFPMMDPSENTIAENGRIFVRNLAYACTEDDLRELMEKFGPVSEIFIPIDTQTKKSKAIAFVTFLMPEHAVNAYERLDGQTFQGRLIHILPAKDKRQDDGLADDQGEVDNYKKKRAAKKREEAQHSFNWNSLFMRADTVADSMAATFGVEKGELLDPTSKGSLAVRMALGETHIVADNKDFLSEQGVQLSAFDTRVKKRSKTVILVKNTPHTATEDDYRATFSKHGTVGRVVVPPSKTMALVEMLEPAEARKAFKGLAYRMFKQVPLFLEWAPDGAFSSTTTTTTAAGAAKRAKEVPASAKGGKTAANDDDDDAANEDADEESTLAASAAGTTTLFVKNVNFNTTDQMLLAHFEREVPVRNARIATKRNPKTNGKLSMGFGFVEFGSKEDAMKAMKLLQHSELDDHKIQLKVSSRGAGNDSKERVGKEIKAGGSKLLIRNLAFEADKKEVRELCSAFGQIKSLRMPKKFDGAHRGFAFVDFVSKKEAKNAFEALSVSTHLYGRRLVIEWASDDSSVEAMQRKTKQAFDGNPRFSGNKRIKFDDISKKGGNFM